MNETSTTIYEVLPLGFFIGIILFNCLCIIVGTIGNVGVIAYNIGINRSKTPTTYFIVNLAVSDILVCLTFFLPWLSHVISIQFNTGSDPFLICKIGFISSYTSVALSVANLLAITVDRFIFISKPLKHPRIVTWKRTYFFLVMIWLATIVNISLIFFNIEKGKVPGVTCQIRNIPRYISGFFNVYMPILCIFYFNFKIYKVAKSQRRKIRHHSSITDYASESTRATTATSAITEQKNRLKQIKLVKTFGIVLGVFLCCFLPTMIIAILQETVCNAACVPSGILLLSGMLVGANSAINPFIYSSRNKEYRTAYRQFFSRLCGKN